MASDESGWNAGTGNIVDAIIQAESSGNPKAVSPKGARGLMQVMPETAARYGVHPDQLFDPNINRQVGTRYFGDLMQRYNQNPFLALVAYNSGPGRVDKGSFLPESVRYATKVLGSMGKKVGGAISSGLEGTAYAGEPGGGDIPKGFTEVPLSQALSQRPSGGAGVGGMKPSLSIDSSGKVRLGLTEPTAPAQVQEQELATKQAMGGVDQAIDFYDKNIAPTWAEKYGGPYWTASGRHGALQSFEAQHSGLAQGLGLGNQAGGKAAGLADRNVSTFYDMIGPMLAQQMRALIGGRLGYYMVSSGPIVPHLPVMGTDSLPRMREKLEDLKTYTLPNTLRQIQNMRNSGMSDDQIIQYYGGDPSKIPAGAGGAQSEPAAEDEPPPPAGFQ